MADKKVNLIISLKDGVSAGLLGIRNGISATADAFKKIAVAGLGAATAIIGGLTMLAKSYAESEAASNRLAATFTALGENGKQAADVWSAYASSIQKITTLDDEVVMGLVTTAKVMGISNDKIKEATEGAIGLSKAFGMDLNSAMKMTAMAMEGEYGMLSRYIPALRTANTEAEKSAIVQRAMATGWEIAKDEIKTVSGSFSALKNSVSDAMETAGEAIFGNGGLSGKINQLKDVISGLTESGEITFWANEIKSSFEAIGNIIEPIGNKLSNIGKGIVGAVRESGAFIGGLAGSLASGSSLKTAWKDAGDAAKSAQSEFEARKEKSLELIELEKKKKLEVVETEADLRKQLAQLDAENDPSKNVKVKKDGFSELYKKMGGLSEYEKNQRIQFAASQEALGKKQGVSGAGLYADQQRAKGISEYDVYQNVQEFIRAEVRGMAAGVSGLGAYAAQRIAGGASSYDVNSSVTGMLGAESTGKAISGGLSDPLVTLAENSTALNEKMDNQLKLLEERLGGVE